MRIIITLRCFQIGRDIEEGNYQTTTSAYLSSGVWYLGGIKGNFCFLL